MRMKRYIIMLIVAIAMVSSVMAQSDIKRPDSYNYQSGVEAYNNKDYAKSMEFFDKELKQNPKNGYAMMWQASIYYKYDMYGKAMSSLNSALKFVPKKDKETVGYLYNLRAGVEAELGDTVKALSGYDLAFKTYPDADYLYSKCNLLNRQERYDDVDAEIKRLMALYENNAMTWVYAGRNEDGKGNYDKAIEAYSFAVKLAPEYASAYSFRAATYIKMRRYREACQDVITALNESSNELKAFYMIYTLADSAMTYLAPQLKAQQLKEPNNSLWSYYLGLAYKQVYDNSNAEEAFKKAIAITKSNGNSYAQIYQNLAEIQNELGKYAEALQNLDECLNMDSTDTRTWRDKADIYYNMGNNMAAIECMSKAISIAPENADLYYWRARYYMYNNMQRNALDDTNTAISLDDKDIGNLVQRCEIHSRMGRHAEAYNDCKMAIDIEMAKPEDKRDLQHLAYAYIRMGNRAAAYPIVEKVYEGEYNKDTEYDLACMYSLLDDRETALKHFENCLQLGCCDFVHIKNDTDLDNIRGTQQFKSLMDKYSRTEATVVGVFDVIEPEYELQTTEVPFRKEAGIYKVKCSINGLPLHFYFDTGAADVTLSSVEAEFMLKNDYLSPSDLKGRNYYGTASGEIAEGTTVILKKVNFGGLELNNVRASVVHNQKAPLLLGQTVLSRLGKIEIDYAKSVLKITSKKIK